jgi:hypothetical protein
VFKVKWGSRNLQQLHLSNALFWRLQELESRIRVDMPGARQEILLMCEGMQYVHLLLSTDEEVSCTCYSYFVYGIAVLSVIYPQCCRCCR